MAKIKAAIIAQTTDKAIRILASDGCDPWLPKSQITVKPSPLVPEGKTFTFKDKGRTFEAAPVEIEMPDWMYKAKGYEAQDRRAAAALASLKTEKTA